MPEAGKIATLTMWAFCQQEERGRSGEAVIVTNRVCPIPLFNKKRKEMSTRSMPSTRRDDRNRTESDTDTVLRSWNLKIFPEKEMLDLVLVGWIGL